MRGHVHLDAVGGVAGDMFVAALLDALPGLRSRVFDDLAAVLPDGVGRPELSEGLSGAMAVRRFGFGAGCAPAAAATHRHHHAEAHEQGGEPGHCGNDENRARNPFRRSRRRGSGQPRCTPAPRRSRWRSCGGWPRRKAGSTACRWTRCTSTKSAIGTRCSMLSRPAASPPHSPAGPGVFPSCRAAAAWCARGTACCRCRPLRRPSCSAGFRWRDDGHPGERVTPTGAAVLAHLVTAPSMPLPSGLRLIAGGMGAGTRELEGMPNVLRALVDAIDAAAA